MFNNPIRSRYIFAASLVLAIAAITAVPMHRGWTVYLDPFSFFTSQSEQMATPAEGQPAPAPEDGAAPLADQFFAGDGSALSASKWGPDGGPYTSPFTTGNVANFNVANGTGTGGNEADSYKKGGSEGIAGGKGDQGRPGGDPNSKNYTGGGHGNSGVIGNVRGLGNRKIRSLPSFTDDFNENGKVVVQIKFDKSGNATDVSIVQMGTTGNSEHKAIALRKARQIKISVDPNADDGQVVTFDMTFKVTN